MEAFSHLLNRLYFTHGNNAKGELIKDYFAHTPDPDRGWALAALAGELSFDLFKRSLARDLIKERVDPVLFEMSYDYVGESAETIAHLWPESENRQRLNRLPSLHEVIEQFNERTKEGVREYLTLLLDNCDANQRWALLKLGTRGLRVGVSARFIKKVLAEFGGVDVNDVESVWHGVTPPYTELFAWLEGKAPMPDMSERVTFHPVMLAHPLEEKDHEKLDVAAYQVEWKYDGIRVQLVSTPQGKALFSRTGDDIGAAFPDLLEAVDFMAVLDGELLVEKDGRTGSFNDLQQRLNRKTPTKKMLKESPAFMIAYDLLRIGDEDMRERPLEERSARLRDWHTQQQPARIKRAQILPADDVEMLQALRDEAERGHEHHIEGLMLKRKDSPYVAGRPKGVWYKWKRDPLVIDTVMLYAQRGHGKRSSFYSDFTFGLWQSEQLLPVGKAYSGFTDEELKQLDKFVRNNTINRFGPVREVEKTLVCELAFDSVHESNRHKSGVALRFPRIHRIRWDKPANEADTLDNLKALIV